MTGVDRLTAHLPPDDDHWLWSCLGASLWGTGVSEDGGLFFLRGESNGGKTTLLESVIAALGRPYGTTVPSRFVESDESKTSSRSASPEGFEMEGPRIAIQNEWEHGRKVGGHMKNVASGDVGQKSRKLHAGYRERPPHYTANTWVGCNYDDAPVIDWNDPAWVRRVRFLRYPEIPEELRDPAMRHAKHEPKFRQALMAKLVRYAAATRGHIPESTPSILELHAELQAARLGEAGTWLKVHVVVTDKPYDVLEANSVWDAIVEASEQDGQRDSKDTAWGWESGPDDAGNPGDP